MLPLEPWIQIPPPAPSNTDVGIPRHIGSLQQKYKEISATIKILRATSGFYFDGMRQGSSVEEWVATLTTSIGPVTFSLSETFYKSSGEEEAKNWCNANVILAYDIKESNTDKAFEAYQLAMVQYNIDLANYHKDVEVYSNKMGVWIQQNKEWLSSKYPAPSRPGPRPPKPATPAVDPGPMPVQPNPPIRPIDPRDMSPVRPGRPGRPLPPRPGQS